MGLNKQGGCQCLLELSNVVNNTGELTKRRKEDILAPAGHPELNVDFSKSKGANIKRENIEFTTLLRNLEFF